ncbi:Rho GTPase-activating protein gacJJ [Acrasis kona]|uniref:Rho GTPase-activating protein gacJJ n=1 Tax=Acrasis kona TaxID=1008807 RepID=A0AAW2Z739_9EUKA
MKFKLLSPRKNSKKADTRVFGVPLKNEIPHIVTEGLKIIKEKYLGSEGLFRQSGDNLAMKDMRAKLDEGKYDSAEEVRALLLNHKEHTVAGMVKLWFRELPDPLLTFDHYDMFIAADNIPEEDVRKHLIKKVLKFLPAVNNQLLRTIAEFLHSVTLRKEENLMNSGNLAIVFAPTLLRPRGDDLKSMMLESEKSRSLTKTLIDQYEFLFEEEDEELELKLDTEDIMCEFESANEATATIKRVTMTLEDFLDQDEPEKTEIRSPDNIKKRPLENVFKEGTDTYRIIKKRKLINISKYKNMSPIAAIRHKRSQSNFSKKDFSSPQRDENTNPNKMCPKSRPLSTRILSPLKLF